MSTEDSLICSNDRSSDMPEEKSSTSMPKEEEKNTQKKLPPVLKIEHTEECGEKSPKARTILELFKNHNNKKAKKRVLAKKEKEEKVTEESTASEVTSDAVNIEFDKMTTIEKSDFLKKLSLLSVGKNKKASQSSQKSEEGASSQTASFFKKLTSRRPDNRGNQENFTFSSSRFDAFRRSPKQSKGSDKRKPSARKLDFYASGDKTADTQASQKIKAVAAMTREYEKIVAVNLKNTAAENSKSHRSRLSSDSYDTPGIPRKVPYGQSSTPAKSSFSCADVGRSYLTEEEEYSPRKPKNSYRNNTHRESSSNASWHGELPPRDYTSPTFSRKIFVGGVPWDITESALKESFGEFGACAVEWPGQEARYRTGPNGVAPNGSSRNIAKLGSQTATGYVYMIFEDERAVASLLHECSQEIGGAGEWYFKIRAQRSKSTEIRQVQIIPWVTSDSLHCEDETILETGIEPKRTVFVGALHGMMTAQVLHAIMEECFGTVECVQLDTDKFKYPIGSGRVTFFEHNAYFKAIEVGYLNVQTSKFRKRVQIDPFLESTACMVCNKESAHCFCRNRNCFKYYCNTCWAVDHGKGSPNDVHIPVIVPSSATKSYQTGVSRRSPNLMSPSPIKCAVASMSAPNQSMNHQQQYTQFIGQAVPVVLSPAPALSAVYGYVNSDGTVQTAQLSPSQPAFISTANMTNQYYDPNMSVGSQSDTQVGRERHDRTTSISSTGGMGTLYINTAMTPKKNSEEHSSPAYFPSPNFAQTSYIPTAFYGSANSPNRGNCTPNHQITPTTNAAPAFYGGNIYYVSPAGPPINGNPQLFYDISNNFYNSPASSVPAPYICAASLPSYQ